MIPAPFDYVAPTTVEEALSALAEAGEDAKVLAGGQSLLPVLRLRLAAPTLVVDLGRIEELRGVREDGDALVIGADDHARRRCCATRWCASTRCCSSGGGDRRRPAGAPPRHVRRRAGARRPGR